MLVSMRALFDHVEQTVFHLHIHVIGGKKCGWPPVCSVCAKHAQIHSTLYMLVVGSWLLERQ